MFHVSPIWIHGARVTSCSPGSLALNWASRISDSAKVTSEVARATQRRVLLRSPGISSRASTPSSGKKVTTVSVEKRYCIVIP
jgi:hypothetical protein